MSNQKDVLLNVRVSAKLRKSFHSKARKYGTPAEVHRELLEAFVDEATDRVENEALRAYLAGLIGQWLSTRGAA